MISSFLLSLQFLTVFPLRITKVSAQKMAWAAAFFPLVGLLLGSALAGINTLLGILGFPELVTSIILVVSLVVITGGIHLDGLADTADAFLSNKPKAQMLLIMRDSHIGVMGVLSLISIILLKIGLIYSLNPESSIAALPLMCVLSRWSAVLSMFLSPYARKEGKARLFIQGMNIKIFVFSTAAAMLCAFTIWQIKGLIILLIVAAGTCLAGRLTNRKIGGITGDTLGATIESAEVVVLSGVFLWERMSQVWIV